jgi:hypothetical protein
MSELSPQAWAVLNAAYQAPDDGNATRQSVAAALRAAADEVVPSPRLPYDSCCDVSAAAIRAELLAIAIELETQ